VQPSIDAVTRFCNQTGTRVRRARLLRAIASLTIFPLAVISCGGGNSPGGSDGAAARVDEPTLVPSATPSPSATPPVADAASLAPAQELLREGRYPEAADLFDAILRGANDDSTRSAALRGAGIAHFENGNHQQALELLREALAMAPEGTPERVRAGYLLGVRLNESGEHGQAITLLAPLVEIESPLKHHVRFEYARALSRSGVVDQAEGEWDYLMGTAGAPASLRASVSRERAEAAKAAGDTAGYEGWLTEVAAGGDTGARLELAQLLLDRGDGAMYGEHLRVILAEAPSSEHALHAADALREGGYSYNAGEVGLTYYRHRQYEKARDVLLAGMEEDGLSATAKTFRAFYYAASLEDDGLLEAAVTAYDLAATYDPSSPFAQRALYWAARSTEALGDEQEASSRYVALLNRGAGEFAEECAFRAGYTLLRAGDPAAAVATWEQLGGAAGARALYWKARAYRDLGNSSSATAAFEAAAAVDPLDYFSIEAARELGRAPVTDVSYRKLERPAPIDWAGLQAGLFPGVSFSEWEPHTAAAEMVEVGLRDAAVALVLEDAAGRPPAEVLGSIREAKEAGLADVAARLAIRLRTEMGLGYADAPKDLMRLAYPVDYVTSLDAEAAANGIDPLFLAALIRQESFWDAAAASHAGALGLTQVIPPTGAAIAQSLGVEFSPEDLFRPAVALKFGANYIAGQVRAFGNPYHALAAYNGGPGNAARWAGIAGAAPADFAEAVDFAETQGYVISVMEHYAHYQAAYR
jgi:soluble lytic murein transglycosylase